MIDRFTLRRRPHRLRRQTRRCRAFTIIETIAAIVILAIGIPPMLWALREAHLQRANPVLASRARWLATEKLEEVIADRFADGRGYDYLDAANYPDEPAVSGFASFARRVSFSEAAVDLATPGTGCMIIIVTVDWTDAADEARSLSVQTAVTEYVPR